MHAFLLKTCGVLVLIKGVSTDSMAKLDDFFCSRTEHQ